MRGMPSPGQPMVDSSGKPTGPWWSFLAQQFGPEEAQSITPTGSPFVFASPNFRGVLMVSGGTVSAVAYSQDNTTYYPTGQTAGCFPMSGNDYLKMTYTVAPTLTYVPL